MSLRARVIAWIGVIVLICAGMGAGLALAHARRSVRTELVTALDGGDRQVRSMLALVPVSEHPAPRLAAIVSSFDGVRHLRATLVDPEGRLLAVSKPMLPHPVPRWFDAWLAPRLSPAQTRIAGYSLALWPIADNEISESWTVFRDRVLMLALFCAGAAAAIYFGLGQALRPLATLAAALGEITDGAAEVRTAECGPPELADLARAFNRMAGRLNESARQTAQLQAQISTLQEEERAELARDLHDEIGPHLFAMKIDASMAREAAEARGLAEIVGRVQMIEASVAHIQSNVREILGRLRPTPPAAISLAEAIEGLLVFWRARRPEIVFASSVAVAEGGLDSRQHVAIRRLIQEGLSNAVRHARPSRIDVSVTLAADGVVCAELRNDGVLDHAAKPPGLGLAGMKERVQASGGSLSASRSGGGWRVAARWPAGVQKVVA